VLAAAAGAACAAGGGLGSPPAPAPPPAPPPLPPGANKTAAAPDKSKEKDAKEKELRVAARVFCADGLDHPYGVAAAADAVLVTSQGSGEVSACAPAAEERTGVASAAAAAPVRPVLFARHGEGRRGDGDAESASSSSDDDGDAATPASASQPKRGGGGADSPLRGIAVAPATGAVYIAAKAHNTIYVHARNGTLVDAIPIASPIALHWDPLRNGLFVGSDRRATVQVSFWDAAARRITAVYSHRDGQGHAAGIAVHGGALLVLGQEAGALYQFDIGTGAFVGVLAEGLARPEALLVYTGPCQ
jgi:DNA-binding beta-propeller fold protein YncE